MGLPIKVLGKIRFIQESENSWSGNSMMARMNEGHVHWKSSEWQWLMCLEEESSCGTQLFAAAKDIKDARYKVTKIRFKSTLVNRFDPTNPAFVCNGCLDTVSFHD